MEMGLPAYVVRQFQDRLEEKLNNIVEETYEELRKELPDKIKAQIIHAFSPETMEDGLTVEVDLRGE